MGDLRNCVLGKRLPLPAWYDTNAVEDFCYALLEALIAELALPAGVMVTPLVALYDNGEALVKLVATVEGDGERPVTQVSRWVNFKEQRVGEIVGEVEEIRQEAQRSVGRSRRHSYRCAPALP